MEIILGLIIMLCLSVGLVYVNNSLNTNFFKVLLTFGYTIFVCAMVVQ